MSKDRGRLTAHELMAQLESDPEWVAGRERRDTHHREAVARDVEAARPVVDELRAAGFAIEAIADLYHLRITPPPFRSCWLGCRGSRAVRSRKLSPER